MKRLKEWLKTRKKKDIICLIIMLIAIVVFVFSAVQLVMTFLRDKATDDLYNQIPSTVVPGVTVNEDPMDLKIDFTALTAINTDIKGWLVIPNCGINYPLLRGATNDTYLRTAYNKTYAFAGSLFFDYRNTKEFQAKNPIIYGHNEENGRMFSNLVRFRKADFANENRYFYVYTPEKTYKYEIFSIYVTDAYSDTYQLEFATTAAYTKWLSKMQGQSLYKFDTAVSADDQILTLSTCVFDYEDARLVLQGKVIETKQR